MSHLKGLLETDEKRKHHGRHEDCTSLFHQYTQFTMHIRSHRNCCSRSKQGPYERHNYSLATEEKKVKAKPSNRKGRSAQSQVRTLQKLYLGKRSLQNLAVNSGFSLPPAVPQQSLPSPHLGGSTRASSGEPQCRADLSLVGGPPGWWVPWVTAGHTAQLHRDGRAWTVLGFISSYYRKSLVSASLLGTKSITKAHF